MTISIVVVIKVASDHRQQFCNHLRALTDSTRSEAGCLLFEAFVPKENSDEVVLVEKWKDEDAIASHMAQPYTAEFIAATRPLAPNPAVRTLIELPSGGDSR